MADATSGERRRAVGDRRGGRDRRREGRKPFVAAGLQRALPADGAAPQPPMLGQAANLGPSGLLLRRSRGADEAPLPRHTALRVSFELPDGQGLFTVGAQVVFEYPEGPRHFRAGLRFFELEDAPRQRLFHCLAELGAALAEPS